MIQNIIFDFDGVLVDSEIIASRAFSIYLAKRDIILTEQEFCSAYAGIRIVDVISRLSSRFNIKDKDDFFKEIILISNNIYNNELTTTKGIKKLLDIIHHKKLICSNSSKERIIKGLIKVNLIDYFDENNIFSRDMVDKPKPDPDVYLKAIEVTGINPKKTIIIEDSVVGIKAGIAAGIKVIGLTSGGHWTGRLPQLLIDVGASAVAKNYNELIEIIKEL